MNTSRRAVTLLGTGLAFAALGLAQPAWAQGDTKPSATQAKPSAPATSQPRTAAARQPITDDDALEFGQTLAQALTTADRSVLQLIDADSILDAATKGIAAPPKVASDFRAGFKERMQQEGGILVRDLAPRIREGATLTATRAVRRGQTPSVILRLIGADGVVSYQQFLLDRRPDGRIRATDFYSFASGELVSETIRRVFLPVAAQANRSLVQRLVGADQLLLTHLQDFQQMAAGVREGRPAEVLAIYDRLPDELKREKTFMLFRYNAAQSLGDEKVYLAAIQDFAKNFAGDPAADFLLIDGYLLQKQPAKSLESLDRVDKALGGDTYLKVLRGNILTMLDRNDDAAAAYRQAIAAEPTLAPAYEALLNLAVSQKRHADTAEMLDAFQNKLGREINDLTQVPLFADFLASPEGKAWLEKRKPKGDG